MTNTISCPDCGVAMEKGFHPDYYVQIVQSRWHPGDASETTFSGNLKLDGDKMMPVTAYRCPDCGLLKQFALCLGLF